MAVNDENVCGKLLVLILEVMIQSFDMDCLVEFFKRLFERLLQRERRYRDMYIFWFIPKMATVVKPWPG